MIMITGPAVPVHLILIGIAQVNHPAQMGNSWTCGCKTKVTTVLLVGLIILMMNAIHTIMLPIHHQVIANMKTKFFSNIYWNVLKTTIKKIHQDQFSYFGRRILSTPLCRSRNASLIGISTKWATGEGRGTWRWWITLTQRLKPLWKR